MGVPGAMALAAGGSSIAGSELAQHMGVGDQSGSSTADLVNQMNHILNTSLNKAIGTSTNYTNQAIGQQNTSLSAATNALNTGLSGATQAAQQNVGQGQQLAQAIQSPYTSGGSSALDAYMDSLGLSRPQQGSQSIANALFQSSQAQPLIKQIQQLGAANGNAPSLSQYQQQVSPEQIQQYINSNIKQVKGPAHGGLAYQYTGLAPQGMVNDPWNLQKGGGGIFSVAGNSNAASQNLFNLINSNPQAKQQIINQLAQQQYAPAAQQYQQTQQQQLAALQAYQNANINPQQLQTAQAYNQGLFSK